ncbi:MAG: DUF982 domain-containing protein [Rhizobium sp.]
MTETLWNRPVTIELDGVATHYIRTTREAAWCLLDDWKPDNKGISYRRAVVACTRAMAGALPDPAARILFIAAARDANLPVALASDIREFDPFVADLTEAAHEAMFASVPQS